MATLLNYILVDYWHEAGDPRALAFPFMGSFGPCLTVNTAYLVFVLYLGPKWMANRPAFSLKRILLFYNIFMSLLNGYFFSLMLRNFDVVYQRITDFHYPDITDRSERLMSLLPYVYLLVASKFIDLLDTVFFVLRRKWTQVSLLHVYHHFSVAFFGWIYFRMNTWCSLFVPYILMNTAIHTLMYGYYALSTMGPKIQPFLWWKKYLTMIQIIQLIIGFFYNMLVLMLQTGYPAFIIYNNLLQTAVYLGLFVQFYFKAYTAKQK